MEERSKSTSVVFPIRGHSYLECDKDFGLINQKSLVKVPAQWIEVFRTARTKPMPFEVYDCQQIFFYSWSAFLRFYFRKTCPFATRPVREMQFTRNHPRTVAVRETAYNAALIQFVILLRDTNWDGYALPDPLYRSLLPIPKKKYDQLHELKIFISEELQSFYVRLPFVAGNRSDDEFDVSHFIFC